MLQKFRSVLHQANTLDEVTGQQQVTSKVVTSFSVCSYKVTKEIIVGQPGKLSKLTNVKWQEKYQGVSKMKQTLALC